MNIVIDSTERNSSAAASPPVFTSAGQVVATTPSLTLLLLARYTLFNVCNVSVSCLADWCRFLRDQFPHLAVPAKAFKGHCQYLCVESVRPELIAETDEVCAG